MRRDSRAVTLAAEGAKLDAIHALLDNLHQIDGELAADPASVRRRLRTAP